MYLFKKVGNSQTRIKTNLAVQICLKIRWQNKLKKILLYQWT